MLMLFAPLAALAQQVVVSGVVVDQNTGAPLRQVSVSAGRISVVTNEDGGFVLKLNQLPPTVSISHLGYKTQRLSMKDGNTEDLRIRLVPTSIQLSTAACNLADNSHKLRKLRISQVIRRVWMATK